MNVTCEQLFSPEALQSLQAEENGYRRGACQALALAARLVRAGATADDVDELTYLSLRWRCGDEPHPAFLDDLVQAWREKRTSKRKGTRHE